MRFSSMPIVTLGKSARVSRPWLPGVIPFTLELAQEWKVKKNRLDDSIIRLAAKTLIGERNSWTIFDLALGQSLGSQQGERYYTYTLSHP